MAMAIECITSINISGRLVGAYCYSLFILVAYFKITS